MARNDMLSMPHASNNPIRITWDITENSDTYFTEEKNWFTAPTDGWLYCHMQKGSGTKDTYCLIAVKINTSDNVWMQVPFVNAGEHNTRIDGIIPMQKGAYVCRINYQNIKNSESVFFPAQSAT